MAGCSWCAIVAGFFGDTESMLPRRLKTLLGRTGCRKIGSRMPNFSSKGAQVLAQGVVNVARHAAALLFLGGDEAGCERTNIALVCDRQLLQSFLLRDVAGDRKDRRNRLIGCEFRNVPHFEFAHASRAWDGSKCAVCGCPVVNTLRTKLSTAFQRFRREWQFTDGPAYDVFR